MNSKDWGADDRFIDRSGKYHARILCWTNVGVKIAWWKHPRKRSEKRATIPVTYWLSPVCGWTLDTTTAAGREGEG